MGKGLDLLAELGSFEEGEIKKAEARTKFLRSMLPELKQLRTPRLFDFYTHDSPDALVENIPVLSLILYGGMINNPTELDQSSDIDIAATFPIVEAHGYTYKDDFNHLAIGDQLRRKFTADCKKKHWGKLPPFKVDIVAYPA